MSQTAIRAIVIVALILIGGGAIAYAILGRQTPAATQVATTPTATVSTGAPAATTSSNTTGTPTSASVYKDGTYSATGSYISPGGDEKIGVTVTLKDDIITAASVTPEPVSPDGHTFQGIFQANFQPLVVGKNIADVHLTKVSGSSLTSGGFNQALAEIETEAKA